MSIEHNTLAANYAPSQMGLNVEGLYSQYYAQMRQQQIVSAGSNFASLLATPGHATPGNLLSGALTLGGAISQNGTVRNIATIGGAVNDIANQLQSKTWVRVDPGTAGAKFDDKGQAWAQVGMPGRTFGAVSTGLGAAATLTGSRELSVASQVTGGVSDTLRASHFGGAGGGITTGLGAALGIAGSFIKGTAGKVVGALSTALSTAGSIISKATSLAGGIAGGVASIAGALIGGETGRKVSAVGSIAVGAMMMAANPILGVIGIVGGLFGLFGGKKKVSKYSEQMAADFKGDGSRDDILVRAAKGKNNNLEIRLTDEATGKSKAVQTIKIGGWFNKKDQSRQQQTVDMNGDGKQDIVWQDKNKISVFINRGDGTFGDASYDDQRRQVEAEGADLKSFAQLFDQMAGTSKRGRRRGGDDDGGSFRSGDALRKAYDANGGEARLGSWKDFKARFKAEGNVGKIYKDYQAAGGREAAGSFANFVAARWESLGIAKPKGMDRLASEGAGTGRDGGQADRLSQFMEGAAKKASRAALFFDGDSGGSGRNRGSRKGASASSIVDAINRKSLSDFDGARLGTGSKNSKKDGSGVSLQTQALDVQIDKQKPGQLFFWDINGDGANDMVFAGEGVKGAKAFLNRGDGSFINDAIDMEQPTDQDWGQLVLQDRMGNAFLNIDFAGDGQRLQALHYMGQWYQLPPAQEPTDTRKQDKTA